MIMVSEFPQVVVCVGEGGGTMPRCEEDSETRFWFGDEPATDESEQIAART